MPDIATLLWQSLTESQQQIFNVTVTLTYSSADTEACLAIGVARCNTELCKLAAMVSCLVQKARGNRVPEPPPMLARNIFILTLIDCHLLLTNTSFTYAHLTLTCESLINLNYRTLPSEPLWFEHTFLFHGFLKKGGTRARGMVWWKETQLHIRFKIYSPFSQIY